MINEYSILHTHTALTLNLRGLFGSVVDELK